MKFLDLAKVYIRSGNGGAGCISFRREKYIEFGGPDGGDGGKGGDVVVRATEGLNTLIDFRYRQHYFAKNGSPGMGKQRTGGNGKNIILNVPLGTEILDETGENLITEVVKPGDVQTIANGGNGGWGNVRFKSSTNQVPRHANPGLQGEEKTIWLRLKLIADVGIFGLPNAGKSTFLSVISNAKPKIASYPFTTIRPNLGVVFIDNEELVFADIPGLIRGAHKGKGIGTRFLGHVERCSLLIHLLDATSDRLIEDYHTVINELEHYGGKLVFKKRVTVLTKIDALPNDVIKEREAELREVTKNIFSVSSVSGEGIKRLLRAIREITDRDAAEVKEKLEEGFPRWSP